jgi:hypothetical protein
MAALSREADKAPVFVRSFADADQDSPMSLEAPQMIGQWVEGRAPAADGPTRTLATIRDPGGNPVGLAAHSRK